MPLSVVIPNKNGAGLIGRCVEAALAAGADEVVVVDDASSDESPLEAERAGATLRASPGSGFAAAVNAGARTARGDVLLILDSDCFLAPDAARKLMDALQADRRNGICGASLVEADGTPSKSHVPGLTLGLAVRTVLKLSPLTPRRPGRGVEEVECVPLACVAVRRTTWGQLSGLDERFFFYFEDQDVCRRLRSEGLRVVVNWDAVAVHVGGAASVMHDEQRWFLQFTRSRARYLRKHYPLTWPLFAVVWAPAALAHAAVWSLRRGPTSALWAQAWWRATWAGIRG